MKRARQLENQIDTLIQDSLGLLKVSIRVVQLEPVLRSRSIFDRLQLRVVFSPAPTPAPKKSRLSTINIFFRVVHPE